MSRSKLIGLAMLLVGIAGCQLFAGNTDCEDNPASAWRASLPPTGTNLEERCSMNIVNPSYTATFTMSPDDLEMFQRSTLITDRQTDASAAVIFDDEATQMDSLLVGSYGDGAVALEVVIDTSDPQQYPVYYYSSFID